ncbi:MAG: MltA domain-containing protein, partial [Rhodospirillales bacterium]
PELAGTQLAGRIVDNKLVPYYSRAEIGSGALRGLGLEVLWVADPVEAFFLHIQGSGRVRLADGSHVRVGYAGRNGRKYTSIGRELVAMGVMPLKDVTAPAIQDWLRANPAAGSALMNKNESFVFFRVIEGEGPIGAEGVALTPGRSLAVDRAFLPYGIPIWLDTTDPVDDSPLRRILIAQDTGSAIKGVVRGDVFWGFGEMAARRAGLMKQRGRYYLLLPKSAEHPAPLS